MKKEFFQQNKQHYTAIVNDYIEKRENMVKNILKEFEFDVNEIKEKETSEKIKSMLLKFFQKKIDFSHGLVASYSDVLGIGLYNDDYVLYTYNNIFKKLSLMATVRDFERFTK